MPYYEKLYTAAPDHIVWGENPGRLVARTGDYVKPGGKVLDAGCGDGKNALFLEQQGFSVVGYDASPHAIQGLYTRFVRAGAVPRGAYGVLDIERDPIFGSFDALVSYGLFHSMSKAHRLEEHRQLQRLVRRDGGYIFFTCLTDRIPLQEEHGKSELELATEGEIRELFAMWDVVYREDGVIQESHPPLVGEHEHAAVWIIASH